MNAITAIVPARGGSKRLPNKNISLLRGRPLIFYTLDAVMNHPEIEKVIFTTDSEKYSTLVREQYGDSVSIVKRPDAFAGDTVKVYDEIRRLAESGEIETDWFMLCLPTAPLRNFLTVKMFLTAWNKKNAPLFSCSKYDFPIQFGFEIGNSGNWKPIFKDSPMLTGQTRSQDIKEIYRPNGAIYIQKTESLGRQNTFYENASPYKISQIEASDIDTELDFKLVEAIMQEYENESGI
jgi:CMP-N,N'-diacetyllegionaminic acid synthase